MAKEDPRKMPGPSEDEKIQVWSAMHLKAALAVLVAAFVAAGWLTLH